MSFDRTYRFFLQGDLVRAQNEAEQQRLLFIHSDPEWSSRFQMLEADALLWRARFDDVLDLLKPSCAVEKQPELKIRCLTLTAEAEGFLGKFSESNRNINEAERLCGTSPYSVCGEVAGVHGLLADLQGDFASAEVLYTKALVSARARGDRFLEAKTLRNLSALLLAKERYDEVIDMSRASLDSAAAVDARLVELGATANIAWANYKLGNRDQALETFREAEKRALELENTSEHENDLTNLGYIYLDEHKFDLAAKYFQQALILAEGIKVQEHIYNALRVLARLSVQTNDLSKASDYAERALKIAQESKVHADELYPRLIQGQIAARRGDAAAAERIFLQVQNDPACPVFLKWDAEHSLALLYDDQVTGVTSRAGGQAESYYRLALATFESARSRVRRESSQLSFLTNGWRIYDDYVRFLVLRGKTDEALGWADYSRARTLAEGLGILPAKSTAQPPPLRAQEVARTVQGTLLFYWLGEKQSYLWAVSPQRTKLFTLPPGPEIEPVARRYREAMTGPSASGLTNPDGQWLYRTLVAPAESMLANNGRVFVIPDGGLNNLNFDTLIALNPQPHYWIEDATIANASSLRLLSGSLQNTKIASYARSRTGTLGPNLLLIGNSVPPSEKYPALPRAAVQMDEVASHFPAARERVLGGEQATPPAYLTSNPDQYSHIHFVAHGTASRLSPLDSAIILSRSSADTESFKLYARDIIQRPLRADLVTISACYGSGTRAYSGEGLVGLSWAFLRAGAHNVVAALWEASDAPTEQLMEKFYDELNEGAPPDAALRTAKLGLLHNSAFKNPFYWAPFQLYTQGRPGKFAYPTEQTTLRSAALGSH